MCELEDYTKRVMTVEDCASSCSGLNGSFVSCYSCNYYYDCRLVIQYEI